MQKNRAATRNIENIFLWKIFSSQEKENRFFDTIRLFILHMTLFFSKNTKMFFYFSLLSNRLTTCLTARLQKDIVKITKRQFLNRKKFPLKTLLDIYKRNDSKLLQRTLIFTNPLYYFSEEIFWFCEKCCEFIFHKSCLKFGLFKTFKASCFSYVKIHATTFFTIQKLAWQLFRLFSENCCKKRTGIV